MPWTGKSFASRHNHRLSGRSATKAAAQANAILRKTGDEGMAIAVANKHAHAGGGTIKKEEGLTEVAATDSAGNQVTQVEPIKRLTVNGHVLFRQPNWKDPYLNTLLNDFSTGAQDKGTLWQDPFWNNENGGIGKPVPLDSFSQNAGKLISQGVGNSTLTNRLNEASAYDDPMFNPNMGAWTHAHPFTNVSDLNPAAAAEAVKSDPWAGQVQRAIPLPPTTDLNWHYQAMADGGAVDTMHPELARLLLHAEPHYRKFMAEGGAVENRGIGAPGDTRYGNTGQAQDSTHPGEDEVINPNARKPSPPPAMGWRAGVRKQNLDDAIDAMSAGQPAPQQQGGQ
jgi:hypothetical protein